MARTYPDSTLPTTFTEGIESYGSQEITPTLFSFLSLKEIILKTFHFLAS